MFKRFRDCDLFTATMWRFIKGVETPNKKLKLSDGDNSKKEKDREYDRHRKRQFKANWKVGREWLLYASEENKMKCSWCWDRSKTDQSDALLKSAFVVGCDNFRLETIKYHEKSECHLKSKAVAEAKANKPGTSKAEKNIESMNSSAMKKLQLLFRNVHALNSKTKTPFHRLPMVM